MREIDALFREAVASKSMPGIVAMAAGPDGVIYRGAFGVPVDAVVWLASMTKAITATAAMQLVESGTLHLDRPAGDVCPELASVQTLDGFDANGQPRLRAPKRPVTLRQLLTHTSGLAYGAFAPPLLRYCRLTDTPDVGTCRNAALALPLIFDPGDRWQYGIGIDWAGKMVEVVSGERLDQYLERHVFAPLGMRDTSFKLSPSQRARRMPVHQRHEDGTLTPTDFEVPQEPEFHMGGGGLYGTAADYVAFTRVFTDGGRGVLKPETIELMAQNHIGALDVPPLTSIAPALAKDSEFFPGMTKKWGLSFLITTEDAPTGRSAGSLAWSGLANTYFWIDRRRRISGVFLTQLLPFFDDTAIDMFTRFETAIYRGLGS
jgi:CubicO group peptidase (beta-lactamase class C family)